MRACSEMGLIHLKTDEVLHQSFRNFKPSNQAKNCFNGDGGWGCCGGELTLVGGGGGGGIHPEFGRLNFLFRRRVIFFINSMEWGNSPTFTGNNHIDIGEWGINLKYIFYFVQYNDLVSKRFCPAFNIIIALVLLRPWLKFDHSVCVTPHLGDQHIVSILVYWCRLNEC